MSVTPETVFRAWFADHADALRAFTVRLTRDPTVAEDVVQETFARAWARLDELRERPEVAPWLYRVARNLCVDDHRARRRVTASGEVPDTVEVDPVRLVEEDEEHRQVRQAWAGLSERQREVLYLRDVEGMTYADLAQRHGLSDESTRAVLSRARRRLRAQLRWTP